MEVELTMMSADEYNQIRTGQMTPAMAAEYLREGRITLRSFRDTLRSLYPGADLQARLTAAFQADDPGANPDSVGRKVRNWLSGQNKPTNREDIFHIAFALSLSEGQANLLLGLCTDYGIHYREGRDVVYAWFLRSGGSYREAREFFASLPPVTRPNQVPEGPASQLTHELQNGVLRVQTKEDLRQFYMENLDRIGALHMRPPQDHHRIPGHCDKVAHTGVAISWIGVQFLVDAFQEMAE